MADGSVKIDVGLNISKAEKDLQKLKDKIAKAEDQLNSNVTRKTEIEKQLEKTAQAAEDARQRVKQLKEEYNSSRRSARAEMKPQLDNAMANYRESAREAERVGREYQNLDESIAKGTKDIADMKNQAGDMTRAIARAKPGEALARSMDTAKKSVMTFLKYSLGIRSLFFLFRRLRSYISDAVSAFAEGDAETKSNIDSLKAALATLRASWGAAFAPILNAVAPLLQKLIGWLTSAANSVARFIAMLSGRSSYKKVVVSNNELAASYQGAGDAAEAAAKQILGFDEINQLSSQSGSSGSGGGGAADPYSFVEEAIDAFDGSFLSNLALAVKDVIFDWSDLNPEQIAQKAISGLSMLLGAGVGFMLGGVPGAIVGTLLGLGLSLVANAMIFDHDGVLSPSELASSLEIALAGLVGGAIGFALGGPGGALIGATVGVGLTLLAKTVFPELGAGSTAELVADLKDALSKGGVAGAAIGFAIGGPGGAILNAIVGTGITLLAKRILPELGAGSTANIISDLVDSLSVGMATGAVGAGIGFILGGPGGAAIGATIGFGLTLLSTLIEIGDKTLDEEEKASIYQKIVEILKGVFTFVMNGPEGLVASIAMKLQLKIADKLDFHPIEDFKKKIKEYFDPFIEDWKSRGSTESNEVGFYIVAGILDGMISKVKEILKWIYEKVIKPIVDKVKSVLGIESPSRVFKIIGDNIIAGLWEGIKSKVSEILLLFYDSVVKPIIDKVKLLFGISDTDTEGGSSAFENIGTSLISGLWVGIQTKWNEFTDFFTGLWNDLKTWWEGLSLASFHIPRPIITWGSRAIEGALASVLNFFGLPATVPTLSVRWAAKGGILDGTTLIGAGEAGKEALIPLEKNTEWVRIVADGLMDKLSESKFASQLATAIATTPMPSLASGTVAPPNALATGYGGSSNNVLEELRALREELSELAKRPIEVGTDMYLDRQKIGRAVTTYQRNAARAGG